MKMFRKWLVAALVIWGTAYAAGPGDLVEGKWVQISAPSGVGSTMVSVSGQDTLTLSGIMAWSGGAYAPTVGTSGSLLVFGGGHTDYYKNDVYAFDDVTGLWSRFMLPTTGTCDRSLSSYPDGSPCVGQNYDFVEYAPITNEFVRISSAAIDGDVLGNGAIHALNLATKTWRAPATLPNFAATGAAQGEGAVAAWDSINNVMWWNGAWRYVNGGTGATYGNNLKKWNPVTNAISSYAGANATGIQGSMTFSSKLKALLYIDARTTQKVHAIDVTTGTPVTYAMSVTGEAWPDELGGFEWDPVVNKAVYYDGGTRIRTITPSANWENTHAATAWTWGTPAVVSGSAVPVDGGKTVGQFGRFRYVPRLCGFIYVGAVDGPVYAYRLPGGAGPGCGGTPPADPAPAVQLLAASPSITLGGSTNLTWSTSNATNCVASNGWSGSKANSGLESVSPTVTTTYRLTCNGLLSQSGTTAYSDAQVVVNTGGGNTGDFAARCAAAGVVRCTNFDTDADFVYAYAGDSTPTRDTNVKASGASSIRFDLGTNTGTRPGGYWQTTLWDPAVGGAGASTHWGPGETLHVQWRQRMDTAFVNTNWYAALGTVPKQVILYAGSASCTGHQIVMVRYYDKDFPRLYTSCSFGLDIPLPDVAGSPNFRIQHGDVDCTRIQVRDGLPNTCQSYTPNNWQTFYLKQTFGNFGEPTTRVEMWMGNDGQAPIKIADMPNYVLTCTAYQNNGDYSVCANSKMSNISIEPYFTGRTPAFTGPQATTWVDDLIVSNQTIAWPAGGTASPTPTVTINANPLLIETGTTSVISWSSTDSTSCNASGGWTGTRFINGTETVGPLTEGKTYTLACTGPGGSVNKSVNVGVFTAAPVIDLTAFPTSVPSGQGSRLDWSVANATFCTATGGWTGNRATSGSELSAPLVSPTSFTLTCGGPGGNTSRTVTVTVSTPVPTITLDADPNPVDYGSRAILTWGSTDATSCTFIAPFVFPVAVSGTGPSVLLTATTTVTLRCDNPQGSVQRSVIIGVNPVPNPVVTLSAAPPTIDNGGFSVLTWSATNAISCTASGGWSGSKNAVSGTESVSPVISTGYTLVCTGANGATGAASVPVVVNSVTPQPVVTVTPAAYQINSGESTTLSWTVTDATTCTASGGWSGSRSNTGGSGVSTGNLTATTSFLLSCTGAGGTGNAGATVTVAAAPGPVDVTITALPTTVANGGISRVTWSSLNATSCTASNGVGDWSGSISLSGILDTIPLIATTQFTVACTNGVTSDTASVTITATPAPLVTITATPSMIAYGGVTNLTWSTTGGLDTCQFIAGQLGGGTVAGSGTTTTELIFQDRTYTMLCYNSLYPNTYVTGSVIVTVDPTTLPVKRKRWRCFYG